MPDPPTTRRSWLRPRYSLRALLLAFTAFGIGFPIWWRWPYEETVPIDPFGDAQTRTWQRQWGGGRLQHGPERYLSNGMWYSIENYRNGRKHGLFAVYTLRATGDGKSWERLPKPSISGQFVDDQKHGVWTEIIDGQKTVTTYDHGKQVSP